MSIATAQPPVIARRSRFKRASPQALHLTNDDVAIVTGCSDDGGRGALLLGAPDGFRVMEVVS